VCGSIADALAFTRKRACMEATQSRRHPADRHFGSEPDLVSGGASRCYEAMSAPEADVSLAMKPYGGSSAKPLYRLTTASSSHVGGT